MGARFEIEYRFRMQVSNQLVHSCLLILFLHFGQYQFGGVTVIKTVEVILYCQ
jgi:hypothetical protein